MKSLFHKKEDERNQEYYQHIAKKFAEDCRREKVICNKLLLVRFFASGAAFDSGKQPNLQEKRPLADIDLQDCLFMYQYYKGMVNYILRSKKNNEYNEFAEDVGEFSRVLNKTVVAVLKMIEKISGTIIFATDVGILIDLVAVSERVNPNYVDKSSFDVGANFGNFDCFYVFYCEKELVFRPVTEPDSCISIKIEESNPVQLLK